MCSICGEKMTSLHRHLQRHGLTSEGYRSQFPDSPLDSPALLRERSSTQKLLMKEKRHQTRRNLKLARWRPGEKPVRHWEIVLHLVKGNTAIEIGAIVRRQPQVVRQICSKLGLSQAPRRYDLGNLFKLARMAKLYSATGLDRESFASCFGAPPQLVRRIVDRPSQRRVSPSQAGVIVKARDEIIHATYEITRNKGKNRWSPGSHAVLRSLVPDFPRVFASLRNILAKSRRFLRNDPSAGIEQWQDWLCQQARLEVAGLLPAASFARFLPLAAELSQFIEPRLSELRMRGRLWRMSTDILASRFKVSASVISHGVYARPLPPRDVRNWILRTSLRQSGASSTSPASALSASDHAAAPPNKGGRPSKRSDKTLWRIRVIAALKKLDRWSEENFTLVYPDTPASASANARAHASRHKHLVLNWEQHLTVADAEAILQGPKPA